MPAMLTSTMRARISSSFRLLVWPAALLMAIMVSSPARAQQDQTSLAAAEQKGLFYDVLKARANGREDEAEKMLTKFLETNPGVAAGWYELSRIQAARTRLAAAEESIRKAVKLDETGNKFYREQLANILASERKYEEAAEVFAQLAKTERYNTDYLLKASLLFTQEGKLDKAMTQLEALEKQRPYDEDVLLERQRLYLRMNDVEGAAGAVRRLIAQDPRDSRYYLLLADVYTTNKAVDKGKTALADAERLFPGDPSVQLAVGQQYLRQGDTAAYRRYQHKAITNRALDVDTKLGLLIGYAQQTARGGDTTGRTDILGIASELATQHPKDPKVSSMYAEVLSWNGRSGDAAEEYKKALLADQSKFANWQQLLGAYTPPQYADSLVKWGKKAITLFPNQALAYYFTGIGYMNQKNNDLAIATFRQAIDYQPEEQREVMASMLTGLGDALNAAGQHKGSDSAYDAALKLDSENATLLNNYAYYLSVRNTRLSDAERMSRKSLQIRPGEATFLDTYGWILFQQSRFADAKKYILQAIEGSGGAADGTLYDHLGDAEFKLGNVADAVKNWERARLKGVDNPAAIDKKIRARKIVE